VNQLRSKRFNAQELMDSGMEKKRCNATETTAVFYFGCIVLFQQLKDAKSLTLSCKIAGSEDSRQSTDS
jgi:hypothetical protein